MTEAETGRAHPDDESRLRADLAEFYEADLPTLAEAAVRWVATGEGFDTLRAETAKAGAIAVAPHGANAAKNRFDQVLRLWQGPRFATTKRPHRLEFFLEPARYEPRCMWRYGVLLAGRLWVTGQSACGPYEPGAGASLPGHAYDVLLSIGSFHWSRTGAYPSLSHKDDLLRHDDPEPYPALRLYLGRKDINTAHSIIHSRDAAEYLIEHAPELCARFPYSEVLANALAELGIVHHGFTDWVVRSLSTESRKPTTKSVYSGDRFQKAQGSMAIRALAAIPKDELSPQLAPHFLAAGPATAAELLDLLALRGGEAGRALLRKRLDGERNSLMREAIERALRVETSESTDGADGYESLDGGRVAIPAVPVLEPEFAPPDSVRADIERYRAALNENTIRENERRQRWHADALARGETRWQLRQDPLLEAESTDAIMDIAIAGLPPPPRSPQPLHRAIYRLERAQRSSWEARIRPWSARPLHLLHLVRLADTDHLDAFTAHFFGGLAKEEVARRLAGALDVRTLRDAVAAAGRTPRPLPLGAYEQFPAPNIWPYFAERLEDIDQAFANGAEQDAMAALSRFPKIPKRFVAPLLNLALSDKRTQWAPAQHLLGDAPSLTALIVPQLASKAAERRRVAAQWIGKRSDISAIIPLRAAARKERSAPVYAAILNALKALGADLSEYFDEATLLAAAEQRLANADAESKGWFPSEAAPDLFWADGRPLKRALMRHWLQIADDLKLASGNAQIDLYLDQLRPDCAEAFGLFTLRAWLARDTTPISEEDLARLGAEIFQLYQATPNVGGRYADGSTFVSWAHLDEVTPAACLGLARQHFSGRLAFSAYDNRGLLAIAARAPAAEMVRLIRPYLKDNYKRMGQCKTLLDCLAANGAPAGLQLIFATATKSKNKGVQKHASVLVDTLAEARGWTRDQLADRTVPTAGLDETGALPLPIGDRVYFARLGADLGLALFNPDGGKIAALPAPKDETLAAAAKEAKAALATAKKELKQTIEMQSARFYEALCAERVWSVEDFRSFILQHPILSRLAERLIWQALDADGAPLSTFRPLGDGTLTDARDAATTIDGAACVRLAHLAAIEADDAEAWRRHLSDYETKPLFPQLTRPRRTLPPELAEADTLEDRQGWVMDTYKLRSIATKLGWKRGSILDAGSFDTYEKALPGIALKAVLSFSGSMVPEENTPAAIHGLRFERIHTNGASAPMLLKDAPPVLLSEAWNDYHDIAASGAFDPGWEDVCPW